jgi:hypothetical protein
LQSVSKTIFGRLNDFWLNDFLADTGKSVKDKEGICQQYLNFLLMQKS